MPESRRELRVATEDTLTSLRPADFATMTDALIGGQIYEPLLGYDRSLQLEGRLAARWERTADGLGYRFVLRSDARFHDGVPVTAAIVRDLLLGSGLERIGLRSLVASVEAPGPSEVAVRLHRPFAPFLDRLTAPAAVIYAPRVSPEGEPPAGSGAFGRPRRVGRSIHVEALRELAVGSAAFVPHLHGPDMWKALLEDRVDLAYECPYEIVARGSESSAVEVTSCPSLAVNLLLFNVRSGPLADPAARRAVAGAIDKQQLLAEVNRGVGEAAQGPLAPASPFFRPRPQLSSVTRGAAPAELTVVATAGFTPRWIELFKRQLARVGTRCTVHLLPFAALRRALVHGSFEAVLTGFAGFVDPDRVLFDAFHSAGRANYSGLSAPALDDLLERARLAHGNEERAALYTQACEVLDELAPAVFLRHGRSIIARRSRVTGIEPHPLGEIDLSKAGWRLDP